MHASNSSFSFRKERLVALEREAITTCCGWLAMGKEAINTQGVVLLAEDCRLQTRWAACRTNS